jgi:hypothetical protein
MLLTNPKPYSLTRLVRPLRLLMLFPLRCRGRCSRAPCLTRTRSSSEEKESDPDEDESQHDEDPDYVVY